MGSVGKPCDIFSKRKLDAPKPPMDKNTMVKQEKNWLRLLVRAAYVEKAPHLRLLLRHVRITMQSWKMHGEKHESGKKTSTSRDVFTSSEWHAFACGRDIFMSFSWQNAKDCSRMSGIKLIEATTSKRSYLLLALKRRSWNALVGVLMKSWYD